MNQVNSFLTRTAESLSAPVAAWPLATLLLLSAITGVIMSVVFRFTSNQTALAEVADRSRGHLLAIKLFKDDVRGMFRSLGQVLRCALSRIWYSTSPMLVLLVPIVLLLTQMALRYDHRPLKPGEAAVVELQLKETAWSRFRDVQVQSTPSIKVETDPLRDEARHAIFWRIRPTEPVSAAIRWQLGRIAVEKNVVVAGDTGPLRTISTRRPGSGWSDRLLYPGEPGFDRDSPAAEIVVHYPRRSTQVLGFDLPWWLTFFVVSIAAALIVKPIVKVRF